MRDVAVVILARAPERGCAKTRLSAAVGVDCAHEIYRSLLALTAAAVASWQGPVLLAAQGDERAFRGTGLERLPKRDQERGSLGERIGAAMTWGFELAPRALVIGSDCPALATSDLRALGALLDDVAAAFGPAEDGGFWAIGAADPAVPAAVAAAAVTWSSPTTMLALRAQLEAAGFTMGLGPTLFDCDTVADLDRAVARGLLAIPRGPELPPR